MNTLDLGQWVILRCASADTLKLCKSLSDEGLHVWSPVERKMGRMRKTRDRFFKEAALMPSYVFASAPQLDAFRLLEVEWPRRHPGFSLYRFKGCIPLIADDQLDGLREEENRIGRVFDRAQRRGRKGPKLAPGTAVRLPDGPFAGISGIVEDVQGQYTLVDIDVFGKATTIKVASLLLADNVIEQQRAA